jgi:hypothetical protein
MPQRGGRSHMAGLSEKSLIALVFLVGSWRVPFATATEPPPDLCSLLTAAEVSKSLGRTYDAPVKTVAPRPYANTNEGTDCHYSAKGATNLWFRAYVDPSPSDAKEMFAKLKIFYSPPTPVPDVGDEAYFDPKHAIHVRKGKVRFYLDVGNNPAAEKALKDLATQVAGRL